MSKTTEDLKKETEGMSEFGKSIALSLIEIIEFLEGDETKGKMYTVEVPDDDKVHVVMGYASCGYDIYSEGREYIVKAFLDYDKAFDFAQKCQLESEILFSKQKKGEPIGNHPYDIEWDRTWESIQYDIDTVELER